jgi:hypothetical protein
MTYRLGKLVLVFGVLATLVGLVGGFGLLFNDRDDAAKLFLGIIPPGFLLVFTGMVMTLIGDPRR